MQLDPSGERTARAACRLLDPCMQPRPDAGACTLLRHPEAGESMGHASAPLIQVLQDHAKHGLQQLHVPPPLGGRGAWPWPLPAAKGTCPGSGVGEDRLAAFFLPRRCVPRRVEGAFVDAAVPSS